MPYNRPKIRGSLPKEEGIGRFHPSQSTISNMLLESLMEDFVVSKGQIANGWLIDCRMMSTRHRTRKNRVHLLILILLRFGLHFTTSATRCIRDSGCWGGSRNVPWTSTCTIATSTQDWSWNDSIIWNRSINELKNGLWGVEFYNYLNNISR